MFNYKNINHIYSVKYNLLVLILNIFYFSWKDFEIKMNSKGYKHSQTFNFAKLSLKINYINK